MACYWLMCFEPLKSDGVKFFGFSEFLAALALLVLAWTNADIRYKFRVWTAPIPIFMATFYSVAVIGFLTLATDLWRTQGWYVIAGNLISPGGWQALLGLAFLATFLAWSWFAFIRPPAFNIFNAKRFQVVMHRLVLRGSQAELPVIAEELLRSAEALCHFAWDRASTSEDTGPAAIGRYTKVARASADRILFMIGDKKLCRNIVYHCPDTAAAIFSAAKKKKKYELPLGIFAKNIATEAIRYKDSFLYHEIDGFESGYVGHHKPISGAIFGDYRLANGLNIIFDIDYRERERWDADQWRAYHRLVLMLMGSYVSGEHIWEDSSVIHRAISTCCDGVERLQFDKVPDPEKSFESPQHQILRATMEFIDQAFDELGAVPAECISQWVSREHGTPLHALGDLISAVVFYAATVRAPTMVSWGVQHNTVWGELFSFRKMQGASRAAIRIFFLSAMEDLDRMRRHGTANYKGGRILGMLLNVMGLSADPHESDRQYKAFHRYVLHWTRMNFDSLYKENPEILSFCLPDAIKYDPKTGTLIKTFEKGLSREPQKAKLAVVVRGKPSRRPGRKQH